MTQIFLSDYKQGRDDDRGKILEVMTST
jgi:hypothetical protein